MSSLPEKFFSSDGGISTNGDENLAEGLGCGDTLFMDGTQEAMVMSKGYPKPLGNGTE